MLPTNETDYVEDYKLIIAGGQDFIDYPLLKDSVNTLLTENKVAGEVIIVSGAADGAEMLGERYAAEYGLEVAEFLPDVKEPTANTALRQHIMADFADACICFWDGKCPVIRQLLVILTSAGVSLQVINY